MPRTFIRLSEEHDTPILNFLWRWKLASTPTLAQKFCSHSTSPIRLMYKRLDRLKRAGMITIKPDHDFKKFYWVLTNRGFGAIEPTLPLLRENGYKSENIKHDALVNALHLGDWLNVTPDEIRLVAEQQLRRTDFEFYPEWVPKSDDHRPDGYWGFGNDNRIQAIAIEAELTPKSRNRYQKVAYFYDDHEKIVRVLWLVPSDQFAKRIQECMDQNSKKRPKVHNYVLISEFENKIWDAKIILGPERGKSIFQLLKLWVPNVGEKRGYRGGTGPLYPLLDGRIRPRTQNASQTARVSKNSD